MREVFALVLLLFVLGCVNEDSSGEAGASDGVGILDLNGDGIVDIKYEFEEQFYYELVDRNFDSKVDESHEYSYEDLIISSRVDTNFDGYLESYIKYTDGSVAKVIADSDSDQLYDLFFEYEFGNLVYSEKYYKDHSESERVGSYHYSFGYPERQESLESSRMGAEEFSARIEKQ